MNPAYMFKEITPAFRNSYRKKFPEVDTRSVFIWNLDFGNWNLFVIYHLSFEILFFG